MAKSGQNSSLFGLRKSGKTSTIYAISRKAKSFSCSTTIIDCQNPAVHARRYGELLAYIVSEVRKSIGQKRIMSSFGDSPVEVSELFFQHMKSAIGQAKGHILIIFDEIENISPKRQLLRIGMIIWTPYIFGRHCDHLYKQKARVGFLCVWSAQAQRCWNWRNCTTSPIRCTSFLKRPSYQVCRLMKLRKWYKKLGYFMGLEFDPELVSDLFTEYGGHPFFIRQVCSKVHQISSTERPVQVSRNLLDRAKLDFGGQLEVYLREIFGNLRRAYPEEFELLEAVVKGKKEEITEFGNEAPELIDHLIGYGIVEKRGSDFDIRFGAMHEALRRILEADTVEGRWSEISKRRNRLESDMRLMFFNWALSVPSTEWRDILRKNLTAKRFNQLTWHEPRILFARRSSPLYLSDLLALLKDEKSVAFSW